MNEYFGSQSKINQGLAELLQGTHEAVKELTEMVKNLNTRLSALEIAVKHVEENYTTVKSLKPIFNMLYGLQEQIDTLEEKGNDES